MRALSIAELLNVWERGLGRNAPEQALLLLEAADGETSRRELEELPVGRRDSRLLQLRNTIFGPSLVSITSCPRCQERLEVTLSAADLVTPDADSDGSGTLVQSDVRITFRLPNSRDLIELSRRSCPTVDDARRALLERCVLSIEGGDGEVTAGELPASIVNKISELMARMDPGGDLRLSISCSACGQTSDLSLDIAAYLGTELQFWAQQTLRDVHCLASAYGWSEHEILSMTPERRRFYLSAING
ncbi:MAG TPA: phage baseplate protein [Thermoanaerobaculia bacterium]|jgi:hypothetical protein